MFTRFGKHLVRQYASKPKVVPNEEVLRNIEKNVYKPRKHPGILKINPVVLPEKFVDAVKNATEDYPVKSIITDADKMWRHLKGRVPPMEHVEVAQLREKFLDQVLTKESKKCDSDEVQNSPEFKQKVKDRVANKLREKVYNWTPTTYDAYNSLVYLFARSDAEYAVLVKLFAEISARDPDFKPKSLFDFGSGIGTTMWATMLYWKKYIYEYFNVDSSSFMNDLAQILLQDGRGMKQMALKGVFFRQFLPANNMTYDLVVSSYSLLELPSFQTRMETVLNLWNKTEKYLVLVEQGTNAGFKVINEARDYLTQISDERNVGHVFSPCPHDLGCPRFLHDDTPCNFEISYKSLPVGQHSEHKRERFSYVIIKKGARSEKDEQWPRVVRETLVRSKHTICRLCTSSGDLQEVIFTASKYGKSTYHCARSTKWGDRLPVTTNPSKNEVSENDPENKLSKD